MTHYNKNAHDDAEARTLFVSNLSTNVEEKLLLKLFGQLGPVKNCRLVRTPNGTAPPYAFVEFVRYQSAAAAYRVLNHLMFLDTELKLDWLNCCKEHWGGGGGQAYTTQKPPIASTTTYTNAYNQAKTETTSQFHVFIGDLGTDIDTYTLRSTFARFGHVTHCRIVRDPQTMQPRGYAFVSYANQNEAQAAIEAMNGQWLGSRMIRTNWSTRKPSSVSSSNSKWSKYSNKETAFQDRSTNKTVYCGGIPPNNMTEEFVLSHFKKFGCIQYIRVFPQRGFAFIKYQKRESAALAIQNTQNIELGGVRLRCAWGKENRELQSEKIISDSVCGREGGDAFGGLSGKRRTKRAKKPWEKSSKSKLQMQKQKQQQRQLELQQELQQSQPLPYVNNDGYQQQYDVQSQTQPLQQVTSQTTLQSQVSAAPQPNGYTQYAPSPPPPPQQPIYNWYPPVSTTVNNTTATSTTLNNNSQFIDQSYVPYVAAYTTNGQQVVGGLPYGYRVLPQSVSWNATMPQAENVTAGGDATTIHSIQAGGTYYFAQTPTATQMVLYQSYQQQTQQI